MGIQIERLGHIGILVSDFDRSLKFYTEVMVCKVTSIRKDADGRPRGAFLRFDEWHHDFVIGMAPDSVDITQPTGGERLIQQINDAQTEILEGLMEQIQNSGELNLQVGGAAEYTHVIHNHVGELAEDGHVSPN